MDYTNVDYTNMDITILKAIILIKVGQIFFLLACIHLVYTCMLIVKLRSIYQQTNRSVHERLSQQSVKAIHSKPITFHTVVKECISPLESHRKGTR